MTSQEVRALIDAKIKGQGTNVDAGSVLPAILNGILDLIDSGGGGGTSDAVQYIPQILTESQQMQARKNQGLYYSEGGGDVTINWDGSSPVIEQQGVFYKVSTAHPSSDLLKTIKVKNNGVEQTYNVASQEMFTSDGIYSILGDSVYDIPICIVITAESFTDPESGLTLSQGIWFTTNGANIYTSQLVYEETETIHHIDPKYIKDMYYEEEGTQSVQWDGDTSVENALFPIYSMMPITCYKASDLVPSLDDVVTFGDAEPAYTSTKGNFYIVEGTGNNQCCIVFKDYEGLTNEVDVSKGIYFSSANTPLVIKSTTVHQVPQKYLPSGGLKTYDIDVEWSELDEIIRDGYGYIDWGWSNPEAAFDEVCQALADGKMIALNIGQGSYGFPGGKLLSGNFVPLNKEDNDGDFASIVFKVYWPTVNPNYGYLTDYSEKLIRLIFHEGLETGELSIMVKAETVTV